MLDGVPGVNFVKFWANFVISFVMNVESPWNAEAECEASRCQRVFSPLVG